MMLRRDFVKGLGAAALAIGADPLFARALPRGRRARVILVASGSYQRYRQVLLALARGLEKLGVIKHAPARDAVTGRAELSDVWQSLASSAGGDSLNFLADGLYSYEFDEKRRLRVQKQVLDRVAKRRDVDLILTAGTYAVRDMASNIRDIPVLSISSSDPIASHLVASAEDSGQDNLHVLIDRDRYAWQTEAFHAVYPFKRLAIVTSQTRKDRCGEAEIRKCCERLGVDFRFVVYQEAEKSVEDDYRAFKRALEAAVKEGADAVVLPWFPCPKGRFREVTQLLAQHRVASFSQSGPEFVRRGILLGEGDQDLDGSGLFEAEVVRRVLAGEKPRSIPQALTQKSRFALNLVSAMQLGWKPPLGLLLSVENAFTTQSEE